MLSNISQRHGTHVDRRSYKPGIHSAQAGRSQTYGVSLTPASGLQDLKGDLHLQRRRSGFDGNALFDFDQDSFQQRKRVWIEIRSDLLCHFVSFGWFDRQMLEASGCAEIAGM
jgi:hypothetical protein